MGKLVSVIVPVYKVEKYLDRCMESIVNQTYKNLEIIVVDDGSPDMCPILCDKWAEMEDRVKVIHKENEGLGKARNTGLEYANGEYVCFVDSDDYIAHDMIENTYLLAKKYETDLVVYGYYNVSREGKVKKYVYKKDIRVYQNDEIMLDVLPNMLVGNTKTKDATNLWMSVCGSLFSMELIKRIQWKFVSERKIIAEDIYSLLNLYKHVNCMVIMPKAYYYYCENEKSLTHTYRQDRYQQIKIFYDECVQVCEEMEYSHMVVKNLSYQYMAFSIAAIKMIVKSDESLKNQMQNLKNIINDQHMQERLSDLEINKESITRKALFWAMKNKWYIACYLMLKAKA